MHWDTAVGGCPAATPNVDCVGLFSTWAHGSNMSHYTCASVTFRDKEWQAADGWPTKARANRNGHWRSRYWTATNRGVSLETECETCGLEGISCVQGVDITNYYWYKYSVYNQKEYFGWKHHSVCIEKREYAMDIRRQSETLWQWRSSGKPDNSTASVVVPASSFNTLTVTMK